MLSLPYLSYIVIFFHYFLLFYCFFYSLNNSFRGNNNEEVFVFLVFALGAVSNGNESFLAR